ncbi:ribonuclease h [Neofusicoccum parvum]|uniref:Ribonuclease h n=1 Tax=Neofusicoccum parvum TaxID=310453 RepID=A0ACB5SBI9_9PEZI|nr:ribonuclease h [Neofusicoccum parvum]
MTQHAHKTCTEWSPTRLYNPSHTLALLSKPAKPSPSSSTTLTPTSPSPATTPPTTTILTTGILSASPPRMDPTDDATDAPYTLAALEAAHAALPFTHLPCPHARCPSCAAPALHTDAILVACAGRRGGNTAAAAVGVYFTAASPFNGVWELGADEVQAATRQRVDLMAGIRALEAVGEVVRGMEEGGGEEGGLSQVVVKTHSQYLVRVAVEWLPLWKGKGWMNSRGRVVANVDLFWYLDKRITWLEWVGVEVLFLLVGREENEEVVRLVGKAVG